MTCESRRARAGASDIATALYYTGLDPFTKKTVQVAKGLTDRKMQRALMQFFKPGNYFEAREALIQAKRTDLIGGCDGLIPAEPAEGSDRGATEEGERRRAGRPLPHRRQPRHRRATRRAGGRAAEADGVPARQEW